mgnify:CR=1 FL=1
MLWWALSPLLISLLGLPPPPQFERAMRSAEGRLDALNQLYTLNSDGLEAARHQKLHQQVIKLVGNQALPLRDRVLATRVLGRFGGVSVVDALKTQLVPASDADSIALAREAAQVLANLGAREALAPGVDSTDPEIRAAAAALGVNPKALCGLLASDPWPMVRVAAARGLADRSAHALCLTPGLRDRTQAVVLAAAEASAHTGETRLVPPLRAIAGDPRAYIPARCAAIISLGHLGDLEPAHKILKTHLRMGGIIPLARAAVTALSVGGAPFEALEPVSSSDAPAVLLALADALYSLKSEDGRRLIKRILPKIPHRQRRRIEENLSWSEPRPGLGEAVSHDVPDDESEDTDSAKDEKNQ